MAPVASLLVQMTPLDVGDAAGHELVAQGVGTG